MAELLDFSPVRALTVNADPVAGAKAYTYEQGTTTPLVTYTTSALTTAHANPVVADANGYFAPVWTETGAVKIVVTDADDVPLYTLDPVFRTPDTPSQAAQVSFQPAAGVGSANVQSAIEEVSTRVNALSQQNGDDRIINGAFEVWQRGTSGTADGYTAADRWANLRTGGTVTQSRESFTVGDTLGNNAPKYFLRQTVASQSLAAHFSSTTQRIEGVSTYSAQTVTVMGWAKRASGSGNMAVEIVQDFGTGGSPSADVLVAPVTVTLTGSWAPFVAVFVVPSIAGKTLGSNGDDFLAVNFWTSAGSDFNARTGSLGVQTIAVDLWGVHVRIGTLSTTDVTDYIAPPLVDTLVRCQRYCAIVRAHAQSATTGFTISPFYAPTAMRTTPGLTVTSAGTASNATASGDTVTDPLGGHFQIQATSAGGSVISRIYRLEAEL